MAVQGRRLVRSEQNKVIAGVAGGIGAHFNVDPILVRIAFVLLALADGIGVIGYLAAWALIPKEGEVHSPAEVAMAKVSKEGESRNNTWIWIVILGIAGVLILANMERWDWGAGVVIWALILIGAGAWLYRQDIEGRPGPDGDFPNPPPSPEPPPRPSNLPVVRPDTAPVVDMPNPPAGPVAATETATGDVIVERVEPPPEDYDPPDGGGASLVVPDPGATSDPPPSSGTGASATSATAPLTGPPVFPPGGPATRVTRATAVRTRRPRSHLGRYTFAVALVVVGVAALMENAGTLDLSGIQYGGLVLATIGAGLLVGTFFGRSRLLILAGLVLLPLMFATNLLGGWFGVPLRAGAGDRFFSPATVQEVRNNYELTAGALNLDLTEMQWGSQPVEIRATVGFGEVNVLVPDGVDVDVEGRATVGAVSVFDEERAGFGVRLVRDADLRPADSALLVLDLRTVAGQVEVARSADRARRL
jgi:phage shock protein PspC (stress-responsive transcriptional regulator)